MSKESASKLGNAARHLRITGAVQGVGYRAAFEREARNLRLSGWVRNRLDGSVEALVAGDAAAVERLIAWAWRGPATAQVDQVIITEAENQQIRLDDAFTRLPTA